MTTTGIEPDRPASVGSATVPIGSQSVGTTDDSVVGRAFRVIDAFGADGHSLSLAELARRSGLPKSTTHRIVAQLEQWGVIERSDDRLRLGIRLFEWGSAVPRQRAVRDAAVPYMEDLYEATRETVHLGLLDGLDVVYVNKICGHRQIRIPTAIGLRMPVHCTGLGKAILAFASDGLVESVLANGLAPRTPHTIVAPAALRADLERIRRDGAAFDREESVLGVTCVAAPVVGRAGTAIGAISVTGPSSRVIPEQIVAAVKLCAISLSRELRGRA